MFDPEFFGLPLSLCFLYFIVYSVLGWCMETVYCSVLEKRLVPRGFLHGPLCPIYGVGALMMILWFQPLMKNPFLFYAVSTVCMSAWEYFVGWLLETATHMKYWDYSGYPLNLHGRICLWVCLAWGLLSFLVLYFIHPYVVSRLSVLRGAPLYFADGVFLGVLMTDSAATVYQLVKASQMIERLQQTGEALRTYVGQGKAELTGKLGEVRGRLEDLVPDQLDEVGHALKERYDALMSRAEYYTRRLRFSYKDLKIPGPANQALESVKRQGEKLRRLRDRLVKEGGRTKNK